LLATGQFGGNWITCDCSFGNNEAFLEQLPKSAYGNYRWVLARRLSIKRIITR